MHCTKLIIFVDSSPIQGDIFFLKSDIKWAFSYILDSWNKTQDSLKTHKFVQEMFEVGIGFINFTLWSSSSQGVMVSTSAFFWRCLVRIGAWPTHFLFFSPKMISFVQCIIFERISYGEFILTPNFAYFQSTQGCWGRLCRIGKGENDGWVGVDRGQWQEQSRIA